MLRECFFGIYCLILKMLIKAIFYCQTHKTTETKEHQDTTNAPTAFRRGGLIIVKSSIRVLLGDI